MRRPRPKPENTQKDRLGPVALAVFSSPAGRELLAAIDERCLYSKSAYCPSDPRRQDFLLGRQDVAIWIHELIDSTNGKGNKNG